MRLHLLRRFAGDTSVEAEELKNIFIGKLRGIYKRKHALPQYIYELFSQKEIPKVEWNIIDGKSRFRF